MIPTQATLAAPQARQAVPPAVRLRAATKRYGERVLWQALDLDVKPGEFLAVLGPNGAGKSTMLKVLLGLTELSSGTVEIAGHPARRGSRDVGFVPQQSTGDPHLTLRGRDLVALGYDGDRFGLGLRGRRERREAVDRALAAVGAQAYAEAPVGRLSGGESQRLRVAQALVGDPRVLMCDEPLLSLDLANQRLVSGLIDQRRRTAGTAVLFVTHEINPVLPMVDRVLYLVDGAFRIGTPDEVMTSQVLSELYGTEVEVLRVRGRLVVVGVDDVAGYGPRGHAHHTHDHAVHDRPGSDRPGLDRAGLDRTGLDRTGRDRAGLDRTGLDRAGLDRTGRDRAGLDRTGLDRAGLDRTRRDRTGLDRSGRS